MGLKENIKNKRTEHKMTLEELAQKVGVSRQTIQRYESGVISNIPSDKIELIAKALDTTPAYLMGWESTVKLISNEMKRVSDQTNLYIQLFESYGYKITLKADTVDVQTKTKKSYTFDRKDFMSMIQRCYKDITYNIERLIDEYDNVLAAHARTDVEQTQEGVQHDLDIMNDDSEWEE